MTYRLTRRALLTCACALSCTVSAHAAEQDLRSAQDSAASSNNGITFGAYKSTRNPAEPAVSVYPNEAIGDGATTAGYNLSRWGEDWRRMCDARNRHDVLDRLKCISFDSSHDIYLTLSGEARFRTNLTTNPGLKDVEAQRQDMLRLVGGADLHIGSHIRFYGEVAHGGLSGINLGTPTGTQRNDLVWLQSFAEASEKVGSVHFGVRYGRQEFTDGPNLLVSQRDNNNVRQVENGVRAWVRGPTLRADLFDLHMTGYGNGGTGDDISDLSRRFSGVTAGWVVPRGLLGGSKLYLDPFLWRYRNLAATWGTTAAREQRIYTGARLWGEIGRVTIDWTVNHQGGYQNARPIDAWQAFLAQTWRLGKDAKAPRLGIHADYASGGGAFQGGKLRDAFSPFGNNIYYSYGLFLTPTNMRAIAPNFTFHAFKTVRTTIEYEKVWRNDDTDAVYRSNGTAYAGTQAVRGHDVGRVVRAQVVWPLTSRLTFTGRAERMLAGDVLKRAGFTNSTFLAGWLSYRF